MLSTKHKVSIARGASGAILTLRKLVGLPPDVQVKRRGVQWMLNLKEGIDFAIYLLGGFEVRTLERYRNIIREGDVVLDIGANIGAHTLPFAQLVGSHGKVIAFEPTAYAFGKQVKNIALNPELSPRIASNQMMLMANDDDALPAAIYSSWPLESANDLHSEHCGRLMETQGAGRSSLDSFLNSLGVDRVDFIKLDVDGNEADVLMGAKESIRKFQPKMMLELAPYVYADKPEKFDAMLAYLWDAGYKLVDVSTGTRLPENSNQVRRMIPEAGGMNVLASAK